MIDEIDEALFSRPRHYRDIAYRNSVSLRQGTNLFHRIADEAGDEDAAIAAETATRQRQP